MGDLPETRDLKQPILSEADIEFRDQFISDLSFLADSKYQITLDAHGRKGMMSPIEAWEYYNSFYDYHGPVNLETVAEQIAIELRWSMIKPSRRLTQTGEGLERMFNIAKQWGRKGLFLNEEENAITKLILHNKKVDLVVDDRLRENSPEVWEKEGYLTEGSSEADKLEDSRAGWEVIGEEDGHTVYRTPGGTFYEKGGRLMSEETYKREKP